MEVPFGSLLPWDEGKHENHLEHCVIPFKLCVFVSKGLTVQTPAFWVKSLFCMSDFLLPPLFLLLSREPMRLLPSVRDVICSWQKHRRKTNNMLFDTIYHGVNVAIQSSTRPHDAKQEVGVPVNPHVTMRRAARLEWACGAASGRACLKIFPRLCPGGSYSSSQRWSDSPSCLSATVATQLC